MRLLLRRFSFFRVIPRLIVLAVLLLGAHPANAASQPLSDGAFLPDEVLVKLNASALPGTVASCLRSANAARKRDLAGIHVLRLHVPPGQTTQAIARLKSCRGIAYAEPNYKMSAVDTFPNDGSYASQYGLVNIRAPQGWSLSSGAASVTIAILDSGIDLTHVDLAAKIVPGYDFVNSDTIAQDDCGHGTHVAGIAAAVTNNGIGIAGVSWGARLMPVKVLGPEGPFCNGTFADAAEGIIWAADHGAQIINMSFGGTAPFPQTLQDAVNYAYARGVVLVAAAGNDATNENFFPAALAHVMSVAATDSLNQRAPFSNYGPTIALAAPGVSIYSTWPGDTYKADSGTSMSAPFVSGLASILRGLPGNASPAQITQEMESTALDLGAVGRDDYFGYGLIQVDAALSSVRSLNVAKAGGGTVTSSPPGIDCGHTCLAAYAAGAPVTLTAVPFARADFLGWSDPACPAALVCTLTLTANMSITANFTYSVLFPLISK